ncbi:MAG: PEGA domain-containing protein [bacterium]
MLNQTYKQGLVFFLIVSLTFPFSVLAQTPKPTKKNDLQTIAIVPVINNSSKELTAINREMAFSLRERLKKSFNILDARAVDQIIKNNFNKAQKVSPKTVKRNPKLVEYIRMIKHGRAEYLKSKNTANILKSMDRVIDGVNKDGILSKDTADIVVLAKLYKGWVLFRADKKNEAGTIVKDVFGANKEADFNVAHFDKNFKDFVFKTRDTIKYDSKLIIKSTTPESVDVLVNDVYVGQSPLEIKLPSGKWKVVMSADNRRPVQKKISLKKGATYAMQNTVLAWDRSKNEKISTNNILSVEARLKVAGLISMLSKARKIVFVDVSATNGKYQPTVQVVDPKYNQVYKQLSFKKIGNLKKSSPDAVTYFAAHLHYFLSRDTMDMYKKDFDNSLIVDPRIDALGKKPWYQQKSVWAAAGVVIVGGIVTGLVLANSGSSGDGTGSVTIGFDDFK